MNRDLKLTLSTEIRTHFKSVETTLLFVFHKGAKKISVCNKFLDSWLEIENMPITDFSPEKFATAVTAWLKQNVLEWSQP